MHDGMLHATSRFVFHYISRRAGGGAGWEGEEKFGAKNRDHPVPPRLSTDHPIEYRAYSDPIPNNNDNTRQQSLENENRVDERG